MDLDLNGKRALVTGASTGLGAAIAHELAREGVRLVITARRTGLLKTEAARLEAAGAPEVKILPADLRDRAAVKALAEAADAAFGGIDILVNNAGASRPLALEDDDDSVWDEAYALNFDATRILTHHLLRGMRARSWGRVLNLTGNVEQRALNAAAVAKAGLHIWAKSLSSQVAADGVTINSIVPGRVWSEQIRDRLHADATEREAFIKANIPAGRFGEPEELAALAAFLASPRAGYMTGTVIAVDGGMRLSPH